MERTLIQIFTDGSCWAGGRYRPGGYGVYCVCGGAEVAFRKGFWNTTTSRMEMMALLEAIRMVNPEEHTRVHIISDSQFIVNAIKNGSLSRWRTNRFYGVKNAELWKEISRELDIRKNMVFGITWVNGHGKDLTEEVTFGNACADALANYKTQENFEQDLPLNGWGWYYHDLYDVIIICEKSEILKKENSEFIYLGECKFATKEEVEGILPDWIRGRYKAGEVYLSLEYGQN